MTPRVLVDASFTPTPLGLPSPNPLSALVPLPPVPAGPPRRIPCFFDDVPVIP